jgi:predicted DNA-binding transcriptional regulator AlpA
MSSSSIADNSPLQSRPASAQPRYLRVTEAARYCGSSKSTFDKLRVTGGGAPFIKIGARVVYRTDDLDVWLISKRVHSTSESR